MKNRLITTGIGLLLLGTAAMSLSSSKEQRLATRVDTATVTRRGRDLVIHVTGVGRTPTAMGRGGWIAPKGNRTPNKDGLLEYQFLFNSVPGYTGFKLKPLSASYKERSVPAGVRGVRIFTEFNQFDFLLPDQKQKKSILPFGKKKDKENTTGETAGAITGGTPHQ